MFFQYFFSSENCMCNTCSTLVMIVFLTIKINIIIVFLKYLFELNVLYLIEFVYLRNIF